MARDLTIHVGDSALLHLTFAAMESFKIRNWGKTTTSNRGPIETAGVLWGYHVARDEEDHVKIEHASTDKFAKGYKSESEWPLQEVTEAKQAIVAARWPYLSLIGDFHTHPYESYNDVQECKGWEFSDGDREAYEKENYLAGPYQCVALVLTVAKLQRYDKSTKLVGAEIANNAVQWQLDRYRYWLAGYAIDKVSLGGDQGVKLEVSPTETGGSREQRGNVYIDVPTVNGITAWFDYSP